MTVMNAVFTPTRIRISVERYRKMRAADILTSEDCVELIEGDLLVMAPTGARHDQVLTQLYKQLVDGGAAEAAWVVPGRMVVLGEYSEANPDLLLVNASAPRPRFRAALQPQDVLLLIEVADGSLAFDQGVKSDLYAQYGIAEVWVVDVNAQRVFVYSQPVDGGFQQARTVHRDARLAPLAFPALTIAVADLFA